MLEESWNRFKKLVVSEDTSPGALEETRKVFMAGAIGAYGAIYQSMDDPTGDTMLAAIREIQAEIDEFQSQLKRGEAEMN